MDKRVFRMAILTIISAFILVLVIVYATNTQKINQLFGWGSKEEEADNAASYYSGEEIYSQQIGSNLDGFLSDEDFFDETEKIPSVVVIKKSSGSAEESSEASSLGSSVSDDELPGMAVVGELQNPEGYVPGMGGSFDSSLYEYNGVMPTAPIEGTPVGQ
ncbi:hypothetical protein SAMN02910275_02185 [Butyrivibrio sp. INlla18]|uniref:hypothetical protein n=1 Tax=Butyrivibrio sp. INlla18 TaxID=1520806 RepID=UPI00088EFE49|nr:hypothetical protein [Butyrivibrio sp. INlla18]SDA69467.1 hypothetical protein SAMN02910275_02185 [Butyrivibrio sp. INlla18]